MVSFGGLLSEYVVTFISYLYCHFNFEKAIVIMSFAEGPNSPICSDTLLLSNLKLEMRLQSPTSVVSWQCFLGVWNGIKASHFLLYNAMFSKMFLIEHCSPMFLTMFYKKAKHRTNDASNNVNRPPLHAG